MHLQTLMVNGFKSFPETKISFPRGITAVVGPNGTGKSNIVDAMLWALGEQSPKTLRSERMEDVIFNGTELRKPGGMVEVSLVFGGVTDQELEALSALGEELNNSTEVMITRRLYRDGESEYSLNKIPCRLKDIRSLLWAARAGTKGHTVIEQGNIDQLLNASPQERREFIEETAGIIRYKKQKAEALRKLDSTEQNLLRVRDILAEVRRQLRSLDRQAKQARDYQTLQSEAKKLEIQLLCWDYRSLMTSQQETEKELERAEAQELSCMTEEARLMAEQEEAKLSLSSTGELVTNTREQLRDTEREMSHALTAIEVERNRIEQFEQQHEQAMQERARLKEEAQLAETTMEAIQEQLSQIRCEIEILTSSIADFDQQSGECQSRRSATVEELDRLRQAMLDLTVEKTNNENKIKGLEEADQKLAKRIERLEMEQRESEAQQHRLSSEAEEFHRRGVELEEMLEQLQVKREEAQQTLRSHEDRLQEIESRLLEYQTNFAGTESELRAIRAVLHEEFGYGPTGEIEDSSLRGACRVIKEAFAERMEVPEQVEKAIEASLGDKVKAWVVEHPNDALSAITTLKEQSLGRGTFLPLRLNGSREALDQSWWAEIQKESAVWGPALGFVQVPEDLKAITALLLESVVIVESLDAALEIMERHEWFHGRGPALVTLEGETVHPYGTITGGAVSATGGILRRRREILRLEAKAKELTQFIEEDQRKKETLVSDVKWTQTQVEELLTTIRDTEVQLVGIKKEEGAREQALQELTRRVETTRMERIAEEAESARLREEATAVRGQLKELDSRFLEQHTVLQETTQTLARVENEINDLTVQLNQARMNLGTLQARWTHEQSDLTRIEEEEELRKTKLLELDQKLEQLFLQTRKSQEDRLRNELTFEELEEKKESEELKLTTLQDQYTQVLEHSKGLENQLAELREALAERLKARGAIEVQLAEIRTKLSAVESTLVGTYEVSIESLKEEETESSNSEGAEGEARTPSLNDPEVWRDELQTVRKKLERMGPINLAAIDEHEELDQRYQFLVSQEEDLTTSIQSLQEIIQKLNQTTSQLFTETFQLLQEKFNEVFTALFAGGRAELLLVHPEESEEDSGKFKQEPGVEIGAQPPGKRLKNLTMLSGGEKTLTVLALLFSSFLIKPSPFCVLDEVDAPLDEANVARFSQFMTQMAELSQFIIITHNKRTMEVADSLFGVTMEEPGISKLVSVRLNEMQAV